MTEDRLPLAELLAKAGDGDFLRTVAEAVMQLLMEADVEGMIGAGRHERTLDRATYRNGDPLRPADGFWAQDLPRTRSACRCVKRAIATLGIQMGSLADAEAVEAAALAILRERKPGRVLETNVEFYAAVLLDALSFPADALTCVFAMGRAIGWLAHAREQVMSGRLIRPQSRYVGPLPRQAA